MSEGEGGLRKIRVRHVTVAFLRAMREVCNDVDDATSKKCESFTIAACILSSCFSCLVAIGVKKKEISPIITPPLSLLDRPVIMTTCTGGYLITLNRLNVMLSLTYPNNEYVLRILYYRRHRAEMSLCSECLTYRKCRDCVNKTVSSISG